MTSSSHITSAIASLLLRNASRSGNISGTFFNSSSNRKDGSNTLDDDDEVVLVVVVVDDRNVAVVILVLAVGNDCKQYTL